MRKVSKIRRRLREVRARGDIAPEGGLKLGGVYTLPDGTELVAGVGRGGRYFLYHPLAWAGRSWVISLPVAFEVDEAGRVLTRAGEPTGWRVEDLRDVRLTANRLHKS